MPVPFVIEHDTLFSFANHVHTHDQIDNQIDDLIDEWDNENYAITESDFRGD